MCTSFVRIAHTPTHQSHEFGESLVRRVDDGRLVNRRLRVAMLHHLQVLRGGQDMLALMYAGRKRSTAAAASYKLDCIRSDRVAPR